MSKFTAWAFFALFSVFPYPPFEVRIVRLELITFLCGMRRANENKKEVYHAWKLSGKSKMAFCKERGLGYHT